MIAVLEDQMIEDAGSELQALAGEKGYRLKETDKPGKYWLIDQSTGLPEINPDDYTPVFNHVSAMQFLLESPDVLRSEPQAA